MEKEGEVKGAGGEKETMCTHTRDGCTGLSSPLRLECVLPLKAMAGHWER